MIWKNILNWPVLFFFLISGMCDFQYLPMVPNADGSFKPVLNDLVPTSVEDSSFLKKEAPLFIMPGNFSRMDTPSGYLYQKQKCGPDPLLEENLIGKRRRRRPGSAYLVPFDVEVVPTEPQEEARQSVYRMKLKDELELLTKVEIEHFFFKTLPDDVVILDV